MALVFGMPIFIISELPGRLASISIRTLSTGFGHSLYLPDKLVRKRHRPGGLCT